MKSIKFRSWRVFAPIPKATFCKMRMLLRFWDLKNEAKCENESAAAMTHANNKHLKIFREHFHKTIAFKPRTAENK